MTTTICDICGTKLEFNHSNPKEIDFASDSILGKIKYKSRVEVFCFNTTNKHWCKKCLIFNQLKGLEDYYDRYSKLYEIK